MSNENILAVIRDYWFHDIPHWSILSQDTMPHDIRITKAYDKLIEEEHNNG